MNRPRATVGDGRPDDAAAVTERAEKMETLYAHLERQFEQLNSVVIEQGKILSRLQKRLEDLDQAMQGQEMDRTQSGQQKPPHYLP